MSIEESINELKNAIEAERENKKGSTSAAVIFKELEELSRQVTSKENDYELAMLAYDLVKANGKFCPPQYKDLYINLLKRAVDKKHPLATISYVQHWIENDYGLKKDPAEIVRMIGSHLMSTPENEGYQEHAVVLMDLLEARKPVKNSPVQTAKPTPVAEAQPPKKPENKFEQNNNNQSTQNSVSSLLDKGLSFFKSLTTTKPKSTESYTAGTELSNNPKHSFIRTNAAEEAQVPIRPSFQPPVIEEIPPLPININPDEKMLYICPLNSKAFGENLEVIKKETTISSEDFEKIVQKAIDPNNTFVCFDDLAKVNQFYKGHSTGWYYQVVVPQENVSKAIATHKMAGKETEVEVYKIDPKTNVNNVRLMSLANSRATSPKGEQYNITVEPNFTDVPKFKL